MADSKDENAPIDRRSGTNTSTPRAVIHKQILDAAAADQGASLEAIAAEVSGASIDLVERVLREYGDPAEDQQGPAVTDSDASTSQLSGVTTTDGGISPLDNGSGEFESTAGTADSDSRASEPDANSAESEENGVDTDTDASDDVSGSQGDDGPTDGEISELVPARDDLSEKQRATLRAIAERPAATQAEIGDELDVSRATVANRLRTVDGFEWSDRATFVARLFDESGGTTVETGDDHSTGGNEVDAGDQSAADPTGDGTAESPDSAADDRIEVLDERVADLSDAVSEQTEQIQSQTERISEQADCVDDVVDRLDDQSHRVDDLAERIDNVREQVRQNGETSDRRPGEADDNRLFSDPELAHKLVHACMDAEYVSEEEELRILAAILDE